MPERVLFHGGPANGQIHALHVVPRVYIVPILDRIAFRADADPLQPVPRKEAWYDLVHPEPDEDGLLHYVHRTTK
jgi:hypothetical protein